MSRKRAARRPGATLGLERVQSPRISTRDLISPIYRNVSFISKFGREISRGVFRPLINLTGWPTGRHNPLCSELVAVVLNSNSGFRSGATSPSVKTANVSCPQGQSANSTVPTYSAYENSVESGGAREKLQLSVSGSTAIRLPTLHTLLISSDIFPPPFSLSLSSS